MFPLNPKNHPPGNFEGLGVLPQLRQLPGDLPVLVEGYETGWDDIHELRTAGVVRYRRAQDWDGEYREASEFKQTGKPAVLIVGRRGHRR